jgi:hypothetical protein
MSKDLLQGEFVLNTNEKITVMGKLDILHGIMNSERPYCSACGHTVDVSLLRKHHDTPVHKAMCLRCFLSNYTNETQEDIDRIWTLMSLKSSTKN